MSQHIYRGFIAFFVEKGKDPADRQNHMVCPVLADDEHDAVVSFLDAFRDERQLIGLQSLEELETLRRMILRLAEEKEVALQRVKP